MGVKRDRAAFGYVATIATTFQFSTNRCSRVESRQCMGSGVKKPGFFERGLDRSLSVAVAKINRACKRVQKAGLLIEPPRLHPLLSATERLGSTKSASDPT